MTTHDSISRAARMLLVSATSHPLVNSRDSSKARPTPTSAPTSMLLGSGAAAGDAR